MLYGIKKTTQTNIGRNIMKKKGTKFSYLWFGYCVLSLGIAVGLVGTSFAQQFDAPYYD